MIPVITIDGPSGSGKGTVGELLAKRLGWHFLDSGALYRALALTALKRDVDLTDMFSLRELAINLNVEFILDCKIILMGQDISTEIRSVECGLAASKIAIIPEIRKALLDCQRNFRQAPGLVADGRDMGTVVFPDAQLKIFLKARQEERAKRRYRQLQQQGINVSLHDVFRDLQKRDKRDKLRDVAPLKPAVDAKVIDTTRLTIDEVLRKILGFYYS
jgi:cytidylate kinase